MKIVFLSLSLLITLLCSSQTEKELVESTVNKFKIEGQIYFLASDELRGRKTGTPEIDIAAAYLANAFRSYGVEPGDKENGYYQNVPFEKTSRAKSQSINLNDEILNDLILFDKTNINFKGEAIYVGFGLSDDYKNKNVNGKIVLLEAGSSEKNEVRSALRFRKEKTKLAKENGALGIIELISAEDEMWSRLDHNFNDEQLVMKSDLPNDDLLYIWLRKPEGKNVFYDNQKANPVHIKMDGISKEIIHSKNVIGIVKGTDEKLKNEFVIYSAHYDHNGVGKPNGTKDSIYNGARDNAVGTVTVLSAAENIAKFPTKRSALFILFTGEEMGLLGSKWYVEHPVVPLNQSVFCFNSDNGGYNDISKATIIGLNRTSSAKHIVGAAKTFGLTAIDDPAAEQGLFDRSDNVSFAAKGIPAPTYSMGFTSFDEEINKYYHQVTDHPESLNYDYLEKFFKSYVLSCRLIANDPETPFWIKGDKYYEAGVKLFEKKLAN
ncbi:M28 family peptidase [Namhaeicola litoreus]|uniref:M28 family peptidase n=1 Tax=Namhaeicola litoreus TaxID=1052145 RepID=A0ABW3Y2G2_9FLAO